jgi:DNA-binding MarR family transcriptional regulator
MCDALRRLADLAPTLKEAELRTLLELTRQAIDGHTAAPSRTLAKATKLSRRNVVAAIDSLSSEERKLITSDGGSATRAASFSLHFLDTVRLEHGGRSD